MAAERLMPISAGGGGRTRTLDEHQGLKLGCLPIPPLPLEAVSLRQVETGQVSHLLR